MVRSALYEAANVILTPIQPVLSRLWTLKRWAIEVGKRRGMKRAKVALARKLACVLHRMWVDGTSFRFGKQVGVPCERLRRRKSRSRTNVLLHRGPVAGTRDR